jgi:uncharacterized membrane protein YhaH (DUF805 family)
VEIAVQILHRNFSFDDDKVLYHFYIRLIKLVTFVSIQATRTRRLRDMNVNTGLILFNFISLIDWIFKLGLCFFKAKKLQTRNKKGQQFTKPANVQVHTFISKNHPEPGYFCILQLNHHG